MNDREYNLEAENEILKEENYKLVKENEQLKFFNNLFSIRYFKNKLMKIKKICNCSTDNLSCKKILDIIGEDECTDI